MGRLGVVRTIVLALAVALGLLIATADERERASVDLLHPTTLLSLVGKRLQALKSYIGARIDADTTNFRKAVDKHEGPKKSLAP